MNIGFLWTIITQGMYLIRLLDGLLTETEPSAEDKGSDGTSFGQTSGCPRLPGGDPQWALTAVGLISFDELAEVLDHGSEAREDADQRHQLPNQLVVPDVPG